MKVVTIGNYQYRAKHIGEYPDGNGKYRYQFRYLLFGIIPLFWDNFYGEYSLKTIENDLKQKLKGTQQIADLNI